MHKRITYRGIESTPVLEEFCNKHLEKIEAILENEPTPVYIDLILEAGKVHANNKVELRVKSPNYELYANHSGAEMYQEIDRVIDKMVLELRRAKEKLVVEGKTKDTYKGT